MAGYFKVLSVQSDVNLPDMAYAFAEKTNRAMKSRMVSFVLFFLAGCACVLEVQIVRTVHAKTAFCYFAALCIWGIILRWGPIIPTMLLAFFLMQSQAGLAHSVMEALWQDLITPTIVATEVAGIMIFLDWRSARKSLADEKALNRALVCRNEVSSPKQ